MLEMPFCICGRPRSEHRKVGDAVDPEGYICPKDIIKTDLERRAEAQGQVAKVGLAKPQVIK